jgi:hypothetical protein
MGTSKSQTASSGKAKGEKKIEGCLESAGSSGQYAIRHRNKEVTVVPDSSVSSEIANHVGHKVKLYGNWEEASGTQTAMNNPSSSMPQSDQPGASGGSMSKSTDTGKNAKEFRASRVEMVSDQCDAGKNSSKPKDNSSNPKP